ncbi:hypothetical protein BC830DRAFT_1140122 [Chytriomyces sp. MP71]|nr:hypothetical protein BC830DRAFT_1140122 [Chytriomyces sp. MP71]
MNKSNAKSSMGNAAKTQIPSLVFTEYPESLQHQETFFTSPISPFLMSEIAAFTAPHFPLSMLNTTLLSQEHINTLNWFYPSGLSVPDVTFNMGGSSACTSSEAMSPNSEPASPQLLLPTPPALSQLVCKPRLTHECGFCQKLFPSRARLNSHILTHTGERPFKCDLCDASYTTGNRLKVHKRSHTGERPYPCDALGCRFAAKQACSLKSHKLTHLTAEERAQYRNAKSAILTGKQEAPSTRS